MARRNTDYSEKCETTFLNAHAFEKQAVLFEIELLDFFESVSIVFPAAWGIRR